MKQQIKDSWNRTPKTIRKPLVLVVGLLLVITSGLIGFLPGPGGIPLFLVGIAVLATEFTWAHRIKVFILKIIHIIGRWYREHRVIGTICLVILTITSLTISYITYQKLHH